MDKFLNMEKEKRDSIINAAYQVFGRSGYKKTSVADIARQAGVSKALIFHYFETKQNVYFFLYEYALDLLTQQIVDKFDRKETDFFRRIWNGQVIKLSLMKDYPHMFSFLSSGFMEEAEEVRELIEEKNREAYDIGFSILLEGVNWDKFCDGVDRAMIINMITWVSEGYVRRYMNEKSIEEMVRDARRYLLILQRAVYKEEYLKELEELWE